jgi:menaquinol-cytochrome c reductase iron-sulfur subunit
MGLIMAAILGIPAVAFLIDPRNRAAAASSYADVVKLSQLPVGEPREFIIRETIRDGWTLRPNEIVGRVFLIRQPAEAGQSPTVRAYTTECPHLGCSINFTGDTRPGEVAFQCPCHGGAFYIDGRVLPHNVAPRDMDSLAVHLRLLPDEEDMMVQVEFKHFKKDQAAKEERR